MKKNVYVFIMFILGIHIIQAKPVTPAVAKSVALTFYKQHSAKIPQTLTLAYTETSASGEALYYVYNVNTNDGFVIVTADDAANPIIGYSTERQFKIPAKHTPINYWLTSRKKEIIALKAANQQASEDVKREWAGDFSATNNLYKASQRIGNTNSVLSVSVAPLVQSDWNQSPYYNADCPGSTGDGSNSAACVTGCVATTMAQIMRYWSYPATGTGSSSYNAGGSYGTLSANYGATTYNWAGMPLNDANITSSASTYSAVAQLMSQAGISVEMNYSPSGSGAYVLQADVGPGAACAQNSYVAYFGYDATTIAGYQRGDTTAGPNYTYSQWINLIETDLNAGRPVQYAGQDPSQGGHTWVCDGYDVNNNVHMNWGWAGYDDGYFNVNNLLTTNGGFNPTDVQEILVGIQPPAGTDAGITAVISPGGNVCATSFTPIVTLKSFGTNALTSCTINYKIDAGTVLTYNWTGSLTSGQTINVTLPSVTTTAGTHTFTANTSNPNSGIDANTSNDQNVVTFMVNLVGATLPVVEGFESSSSLPSGWSIGNPDGDAAWAVNTSVAHTGSHSLAFDNCDGDGSTDMTGRIDWAYSPTYDFSSASSGNMSFDVGYLPTTDGSVTYTDTLVVYYSIDCGATWSQIYKKGGVALSTGPVFTITSGTSCAVPSSSQWRTDNITLPGAVGGHSNVQFAFKNISDWGDWLYLDNINITANSSLGIASLNNTNTVIVYPNPAHNSLFINTAENTTSVSVTNIIGQVVVAEQKVAAQQVHSIDISSLANGVYLVKVNSSDNQVKVIRFIKN